MFKHYTFKENNYFGALLLVLNNMNEQHVAYITNSDHA